MLRRALLSGIGGGLLAAVSVARSMMAPVGVVPSSGMSRVSLALTSAVTIACTPHVEPGAPASPTLDVAAAEVRAEPPSGAPVPATTTWTTLTVAPDCAVQIADAPAALGVPLSWRPCDDGPAGCRELSNKPEIPGGVAVAGLGHGDRVTIAASIFTPGPRVRHVLAPRDGLPFFAVEGPREARCSLATVGLTDDGAAIEVSFDNREGFASRAYLRGPLREDPAWRTVTASLLRRDFPEFIGESVFSAGGRVVVEQSGGPLRWYDVAAGRWVEVPGSREGWECCASGHGDAVSFLLETIPEKAMAARLGEAAHPLRRGAVEGMSPVAIDGTRAVWVEGRGRDRNNYYGRVELWTGELSRGLTLETATMVAVLPRRTMARPTLGGGVVAIPLEDRGNGLAVVRLGTTGLKKLAAPPDQSVERLLWVAADEIAVQIGPGTMAVEPSRVRRIPLDALPPLPRGG